MQFSRINVTSLFIVLNFFFMIEGKNPSYHFAAIELIEERYIPFSSISKQESTHEMSPDLAITACNDRHDNSVDGSNNRFESSHEGQGTSSLFERFEHYTGAEPASCDTSFLNYYDHTSVQIKNKVVDDDLKTQEIQKIIIESVQTNEAQIDEVVQENNSIKNLYGFKEIWPDGVTMEKEIQLWQQELKEWPGASQKAAQERCNARCAAYEKTKNNPYVLTTQLYQLSDDGTELLHKNEIDPLVFTQGIYNPLQHQLHIELLDIVERTADFIKYCAYKREFESSRNSLVSLATIGAQFNKIGDAIKTATIADVCWKLVECELALKQGIADGVINVATYVWENPHEVILYALAPEVMGGYYMAKLAYNIGAGIKSLCTEGVEQKTIDNLTLPGTIQVASTLLASMYLNGKIDRQFVKCGNLAKNAVKDAIKNRDPALCFAGNNLNQVRSQRFHEKPSQKQRKVEDLKKMSGSQPRAALSPEQIRKHAEFMQKLGKEIGSGEVCFSKVLPKNPNDLEIMGWQDVTDPRMRLNSSGRDYYHAKYDINVRFDTAQLGAPGFKGIDHYQIYNPVSNHIRFRYLDIHGNIVGRGEASSHIVVEKLKNACSCQKD